MKKMNFRPTYRRHRKQRFWQIIFPLLVVALLLLTVGGLALLGSNGQASLWADTALVWLLWPFLLLLLIPLALTVAAVVGMAALLQKTPAWFALAQNWMEQTSAQVRRWSNRAASPFIRLGGWGAAARRALGRKPRK